MADDTTWMPSTARYWDVQHCLTVLNLSNETQVQQRPHVVDGAEESELLAESYPKGELI